MLGPSSAPSSPPDTPMPMKRRFLAFSASKRRLVSVNSELPPSITMSPGSSSGTSSSMTSSTGLPALTMMMMTRGLAERRHETFQVLRRREAALVAELLDQFVGALAMAVEKRDAEAFAGRVPGQVGAHDGEAQNAEITKFAHVVVSPCASTPLSGAGCLLVGRAYPSSVPSASRVMPIVHRHASLKPRRPRSPAGRGWRAPDAALAAPVACATTRRRESRNGGTAPRRHAAPRTP